MTPIESKAFKAGWRAFYDQLPRAVVLSTLAEEKAWHNGYDAAQEYEYERQVAQEFSDLSTWMET